MAGDSQQRTTPPPAGWRAWLAHAFAVEPPGEAAPQPHEQALVDRLVDGVVRRQLATAALVALETVRPLNYLGSQLLHVLGPVLSVVLPGEDHRTLAGFLERRGSMEYLCRRLAEAEARRTAAGSSP